MSRILKVIGAGLLGGVMILVMLLATALIFHMIFYPDRPMFYRAGTAEVLFYYAGSMSPGFFCGVIVSAFRLRPIVGAIAGALCGITTITIIYACWWGYYWGTIPASYLWFYVFSVAWYSVFSSIVGAILGFLSPRKELQPDEPPPPDQFDFL